MSLSVVVPCYRSARILPTLVERLNGVLPGITPDHEVILVVDSTDNTWDVASELAGKYEHVQAIRMARNYGQHNALIAGIRAASFERIITMDDDLQHPPEELPKLVDALTDDLDVVYAISEQEEHSAFRNLTSWGAKTLVMGRTMGIPNADVLGALRIFRTFLRAGFEQVSGPHVSVDIVLSWTTTRVGTATVRMDQRTEGRSGFTFKSLMKHAVNMILGYSTKPLRLVTYLGFLIGICGLILTIRLVWLYVVGDTTVAGFTTVASLVTVFSSAQLIGIGVLGEYLGRVHAHGMGRPTYVVREHVNSPAARPASRAVSRPVSHADVA
ncbi:glycosyltransferase family 2 protein [Dactylosporangium maewongense]|uniref:Glycosyltransferase family 2 protein n=1 Tax=Dactylosporangium maewongense TaxID=634393 RepID=A0ABN1ZT23_9ACTN